MSEYRNHAGANRLEPQFSRHMEAMTSERLESKGEIAAELAHRDAHALQLHVALSHATSLLMIQFGPDLNAVKAAVAALARSPDDWPVSADIAPMVHDQRPSPKARE